MRRRQPKQQHVSSAKRRRGQRKGMTWTGDTRTRAHGPRTRAPLRTSTWESRPSTSWKTAVKFCLRLCKCSNRGAPSGRHQTPLCRRRMTHGSTPGHLRLARLLTEAGRSPCNVLFGSTSCLSHAAQIQCASSTPHRWGGESHRSLAGNCVAATPSFVHNEVDGGGKLAAMPHPKHTHARAP